jgi:hypothetical protein
MDDRAFVCIVIFGLVAALLAGVCAYLLRVQPLVEDLAGKGEPATPTTAQQIIPVLPDDQLPSLRDFARYNNLGPSTSIASTPPPDYFNTVTTGAPTVAPSPSDSALVSIPLPPRRPQHLPRVSNGLLNDAQITGVKNRLKLSPKQAEYWPEVEAALRDVAQRHGQGTQRNSAWVIDVNSPEVQRLVQVSVLLIRELREDQKRELRQLVRMIGLGSVALQI